jgi:hypothetical protein
LISTNLGTPMLQFDYISMCNIIFLDIPPDPVVIIERKDYCFYVILFILRTCDIIIIIIHYVCLVFILDTLNLHLSGGVEYIHVKDGYIGRIPTTECQINCKYHLSNSNFNSSKPFSYSKAYNVI